MLVGLTLRRMWRERRLMLVVFVAICLVTGFMALGPLYVQAIAASEFEIRLQNAEPRTFTTDIRNPTPLDDAAVGALVAEHLGELVQTRRVYDIGVLTCGFFYSEDTLAAQRPPTTMWNCYRPTAYENPEDVFTLVEGRFPMPTEAGEDAEVVITTQGLEVARDFSDRLDYSVGDRLVVGESARTAIVSEIVGIVELALPEDDPFWQGQPQINGQIQAISSERDRANFSVIYDRSTYQNVIAPIVESSEYIHRLQLTDEQISLETLPELESGLRRIDVTLRDSDPNVTVESGLDSLINAFRRSIREAEGPILLLSVLVLALMLYNLVTTIALILEQQGVEWAVISSRGGSVRQLVQLHGLTVLILALFACLLGPLIALLILWLLSAIGPQAAILNAPRLNNIPVNSFLLSLVAALAALAVLVIPAVPRARESLLRLKRSASRPPTAPAWARLGLDVILLVIGVGFIVRLYLLVTGDAGGSIGELIRDPTTLARSIAESGTAGLGDPFNLIGPVLLLAGLALLWMRLFPWLMRLFSLVFQRINALTVNLALWNVERDPGHYAQLVLLLIGTLALGTASLSLTTTRNTGAWDVAIGETGAGAQVALEPATADYDWGTLPDAESGASLLVSRWPLVAPEEIAVFGLDVDEFQIAFPDYDLAVLENPDVALDGLALPDEPRTFALDVYTEPDAEGRTITTNILLDLFDSNFVRVTVPMTVEDPAQTGEFVTHQATLNPEDDRPWRFAGIRFDIEREDGEEFDPTLYLDNLRVTTASGDTQTLISFEPGTPNSIEQWEWNERSGQMGAGLTLREEDTRFTEGAHSLRVRYREVPNLPAPTVLEYNIPEPQPIPVMISPRYAQVLGDRNRLERPAQTGDELQVVLQEPTATDSRPDVTLSLRVLGVLNGDRARPFPTVGEDTAALVAPRQLLQMQMNHRTSPVNFYGVNQGWVNLETRQPTAAFEQAVSEVPGYRDVDYAWERFNAIQREPLTNAVTGILFAGFWVSLGLILLDFAFYLAVTTRQRASSFAVLRSIGWRSRSIWGLLTVEQAAFITPALLVGVLLGVFVAYLILPFLALIGGNALQVPLGGVLGLLVVLVLAFTILLAIMAVNLQRRTATDVLRAID